MLFFFGVVACTCVAEDFTLLGVGGHLGEMLYALAASQLFNVWDSSHRGGGVPSGVSGHTFAIYPLKPPSWWTSWPGGLLRFLESNAFLQTARTFEQTDGEI